MQRFPYFLVIYNMFKNKRGMAIKSQKKRREEIQLSPIVYFLTCFLTNEAGDVFYIDCICTQKGALYTKYYFVYFILRLIMVTHHEPWCFFFSRFR
jgi:hypothetical protein